MANLNYDLEDAVITFTIKAWTLNGKTLGRTVLQKLVYFIRAKGIPMTFNYDLYHYGPYSQELSQKMDWLQIENIVIDDGTEIESKYQLGPKGESVLSVCQETLKPHEKSVMQVVEAFLGKTTKEMELLATTHFVQVTGEKNDLERTIREVQRIKGRKFPPEEISNAVYELNLKGFSSNG